MRLLWLVALPLTYCFAPALPAQDEPLSASTLPRFLDGYQQTLRLVDAAFADILSENIPLLDDSGKPVGRRNIEDRHKQVTELRDAAKELAAAPQDLVLVLNLFDTTETLADEVYDLSQIAFNNDLEELGNRLSGLLLTVDHDQDALGKYALSLAGEKQKRITELEREVRDLQQKLKQAAEKPKATR